MTPATVAFFCDDRSFHVGLFSDTTHMIHMWVCLKIGNWWQTMINHAIFGEPIFGQPHWMWLEMTGMPWHGGWSERFPARHGGTPIAGWFLWGTIPSINGWWLRVPSGKRLHNYRKSPLLMGKSTISVAHFQVRKLWILPEATKKMRSIRHGSWTTWLIDVDWYHH